jgi:adenosylhomocysteinase
MMISMIKDPGLWALAKIKIDWARRFMPVTGTLSADLGQSGLVSGLRIGLCLVLEPKTAVLAQSLADAGAEVIVYCNARSTRDDVAAALDHAGITVFARSDATPEQDRDMCLALLDSGLDILVDDGATVIRMLHQERPDLITTMIGATEETTSGIRLLRLMDASGDLLLPVVAVNDARSKTLFDNADGTGQSTLFTALDLLDLSLTDRRVVVIGYGPVGQGVARHAAAFGAEVCVADHDPVAALQAEYDGHRTGPTAELVRDADLVISATGVRHTIELDHLGAMPDGCAVAVAGGVPEEIALNDLATQAGGSMVGDRLVRWEFDDGHGVVVLDDGGCINCTAGEGNPIQIMDLSWGVQLAAIGFLAENADRLSPGLMTLPDDRDRKVAAVALAARGHQR